MFISLYRVHALRKGYFSGIEHTLHDTERNERDQDISELQLKLLVNVKLKNYVRVFLEV